MRHVPGAKVPSMLALPITPRKALQLIIPPAMDLLPARMRSDRSDVQLLAISMQESGLADRRQGTELRPGPARGLLQFEVNGVRGVMNHRASGALLRQVCLARNVLFDARSIHLQLELDDVLAFALARLLLWTDPRPLPPIGALDAAFDCYARNWRPGALKTPEGYRECLRRWRRNYPLAVQAVKA